MYPWFIFIRNGQAAHHQLAKKIQQKYPKNTNLKQIPQFQQLKYNKQLLDQSLTKTGIEQAKLVKQQINQQHIDVVVVSPLRRALQTCDIIFGQSNNIKIIVQPLMTQRITSVIDIGVNIKQLRSRYGEKFDFSAIRHQQQQRWYLDKILSEQNKKQILQIAQKLNIDIGLATLEVLQHRKLETHKQFQFRILRLKQQLAKYYQQSKKKTVLIGHKECFRYLTATGFFPNGDPINDISLNNCQPAEIPIIIDGIIYEKENQVPFCKIP